jgi:hypothetical protein
MEVPQGNSLCSYLKQTKMSFFCSFTKLENRGAEQVLLGVIGTSGREEEVRKGIGVQIWFKYYVHKYVNEKKMIAVETVPGMERGEIRENGGEGKLK